MAYFFVVGVMLILAGVAGLGVGGLCFVTANGAIQEAVGGVIAMIGAILLTGGFLLFGNGLAANELRGILTTLQKSEQARINRASSLSEHLNAIKEACRATATQAGTKPAFLRCYCEHCGTKMKCSPEMLGTVGSCSECGANTTLLSEQPEAFRS